MATKKALTPAARTLLASIVTADGPGRAILGEELYCDKALGAAMDSLFANKLVEVVSSFDGQDPEDMGCVYGATDRGRTSYTRARAAGLV